MGRHKPVSIPQFESLPLQQQLEFRRGIHLLMVLLLVCNLPHHRCCVGPTHAAREISLLPFEPHPGECGDRTESLRRLLVRS